MNLSSLSTTGTSNSSLSFWSATNGVLRAREWVVDPSGQRRIWLLTLTVVFGSLYGAIMGSLTLEPLQILYSAIKAPFLFMASFGISLPSFFVLTTLLGLRHDFRTSVQALIAAQSGFAVVLASLGPFTAFVYTSGLPYGKAVVWNGIMYFAASLGAQYLLRQLYAPLIAKDRRHRVLLFGWLVIYCFVAIQMAWMLRPFIGAPNLAPTFFRSGEFENAYEVVFQRVWGVLFGG